MPAKLCAWLLKLGSVYSAGSRTSLKVPNPDDDAGDASQHPDQGGTVASFADAPVQIPQDHANLCSTTRG